MVRPHVRHGSGNAVKSTAGHRGQGGGAAAVATVQSLLVKAPDCDNALRACHAMLDLGKKTRAIK